MEQPLPLYQNTTQPPEVRAADLVARLTLDEKISQMQHAAPAVDRLGIPEYNWWNECLHGVGRAGTATVFPQAIGLAATWNTDLLAEVVTAIGDEGRAKHHEAARSGNRSQYYGLTFWTPNINIFRDPRWGRGQETYGEDPYLTARFGVTFVKYLQGDDPKYLKAAACAKHYAVHSGPENGRHYFNAVASPRDLWDTYLPAFEALVTEAKVEAVMGAYNRTNGEPCCASPTLLEEILRQRWGFQGHVVSDCWAIDDIFKHHRVVETAEEAVALAVNAGCDLECGCAYGALVGAVEQGLIDEPTIDRAVTRLMTTRFRLGLFDPDEAVPYAAIPYSVNDSAEHAALALRTARESMVLLKNEAGFLPLPKTLKRVAVIGPNADDLHVLLGNYNGTPSNPVTPLAGIRAKLPDAEVVYARGSSVWGSHTEGYDEALRAARDAEVIIYAGGLSQAIEGEEGQHESVPDDEKSMGDRVDIVLPPLQQNLLEQLHQLGKPVVLVLINGGAVSVPWANAHLPAILEAWYPGQAAGTAIADVLFGDYNPGGRLPVTVYRSLDDLPGFHDYDMTNRTYRYFTGEPLYPFGYGLSYTDFAYRNLRLSRETLADGQALAVTVDVQNVGQRAGDEVAQLYLRHLNASIPAPRHSLQGFQRLALQPGETRRVTFTLESRQFSLVSAAGERVLEPGEVQIFVGGGQPSDETPSAVVTVSG